MAEIMRTATLVAQLLVLVYDESIILVKIGRTHSIGAAQVCCQLMSTSFIGHSSAVKLQKILLFSCKFIVKSSLTRNIGIPILKTSSF